MAELTRRQQASSALIVVACRRGRQILTIQSITRLEGHGKIDIDLGDQGDVEPYPSLSRGLWRRSPTQSPSSGAKSSTESTLSRGVMRGV